MDYELSDILSESIYDDDSVERLDAIWSDILEDDRFELSFIDDD